jgi:cob(I)alamin adenosyltransferase
MKIYTKTGDKGETSLFGGERIWKDNPRIAAYGSVDELNSALGIALSEIQNKKIQIVVRDIQNVLFTVGSDLATPFDKGNKGFVIPRLEKESIEKLEKTIDELDSQLPELKNFILPGGLKGAAYLHLARTICRRSEREVVTLSKSSEINSHIGVYLNRLSDLLFVLARFENFSSNHPDIEWEK